MIHFLGFLLTKNKSIQMKNSTGKCLDEIDWVSSINVHISLYFYFLVSRTVVLTSILSILLLNEILLPIKKLVMY